MVDEKLDGPPRAPTTTVGPNHIQRQKRIPRAPWTSAVRFLLLVVAGQRKATGSLPGGERQLREALAAYRSALRSGEAALRSR